MASFLPRNVPLSTSIRYEDTQMDNDRQLQINSFRIL